MQVIVSLQMDSTLGDEDICHNKKIVQCRAMVEVLLDNGVREDLETKEESYEPNKVDLVCSTVHGTVHSTRPGTVLQGCVRPNKNE